MQSFIPDDPVNFVFMILCLGLLIPLTVAVIVFIYIHLKTLHCWIACVIVGTLAARDEANAGMYVFAGFLYVAIFFLISHKGKYYEHRNSGGD